MELFYLNRPSLEAKPQFKKSKTALIQKDLITTNAETQEIKILRSFVFNLPNERIPRFCPKEITKDEDLQQNSLQELIEQQLLLLKTNEIELQGLIAQEDELESRVIERKAFFLDEVEAYEKKLKDIEKSFTEVKDEINIVETEYGRNQSSDRMLICNNESATLENKRLQREIKDLQICIEEIENKSREVKNSTLHIEELIQNTQHSIDCKKPSLKELIEQCFHLHRLTLNDTQDIYKIEEDISRLIELKKK